MEKQAKTCEKQQNAIKTPVNQHSMNRTALQVKEKMLYIDRYRYRYRKKIDIDDIDIDDCFLPCDLVGFLQHAVAKGSPLTCVSQGVLHVAACGSSFYGSVLCAFGLGMLDADGWF